MCSRTFNPLTWRSIFLSVTVGLALFINFSSGTASAEVSDFEVVTPENLEPAVRTWTAASGSTVDAKFVRLDGENVILGREDGVEFRIPGSRLSAGDIAYVEARTSSQIGSEVPPPEPASQQPAESSVKKIKAPAKLKANQIPVFSSGKWIGEHAVYEHANFDAVVDIEGMLLIHLKNQGERIDKPLKVVPLITYRTPYRSARIIELTPPGDPVMQPESVTLQGKTKDRQTNQEVDFEVTYSFEGNEISAWGRSLGEGSYNHPEIFEVAFRGPKTHDIKPSVEQPERIRILNGYSLLLKGGAGGSRAFNYYSSPKFGGAKKLSASNAELIGPLWEPRKIRVSASSKKAPLIPYVYPGKLLWEGFRLFLRKPDPRAENPSQKMVITIE